MEKITERKIDQMITEAINALISDTPEKASEALTELAFLWASAGIPKTSFNDLRQYVVSQAMSQTSVPFIEEKLRLAERINRKKRDDLKKSG
jgi:hypothetical protein